MTKRVTLRELLQGVYTTEDLSTVCCRQCTCCRVACPQMKYSEATQITGVIFNDWSKEDKLELLTTCVRYFFSDSLIKPCPMLKDDTCRTYEDRPLSCRIYGLWPEKVWSDKVSNFSKVIGLPEDKLPLNKQCGMVTRANGLPPLTMEQIEPLYTSLDSIDMMAGTLSEEQIIQQWNTRTIHDWILLKFYGEEKLIIMSEMKSKAKPEEIEEIIKIISEAAEKLL
jgi:Fe-S-cluster containining protein